LVLGILRVVVLLKNKLFIYFEMKKQEVLVDGRKDSELLKQFGIEFPEVRENLKVFQDPDKIVLTRRGMKTKNIDGERRIV